MLAVVQFFLFAGICSLVKKAVLLLEQVNAAVAVPASLAAEHECRIMAIVAGLAVNQTVALVAVFAAVA